MDLPSLTLKDGCAVLATLLSSVIDGRQTQSVYIVWHSQSADTNTLGTLGRETVHKGQNATAHAHREWHEEGAEGNSRPNGGNIEGRGKERREKKAILIIHIL